MNKKLKKKIIRKVKILDPKKVYINKKTKFGKNILIEPFVVIGENVEVGDNVTIKSFSHIEDAKIKSNVEIGPYARIRPGTVLEQGSKIGNFVEIKKSKVGKKSKINHLSYVGDSEIGDEVNVGAGTITCNYDGKNKYKTTIKDKAFIGSNTSLIAPVIIGRKALVGAGSVITKDVKDNYLSLTRSKQKNYKKKK